MRSVRVSGDLEFTYFGKSVPPYRYYVAEGVRIYSQDTWKLVLEEKGKQLVETYIANVVW